MNRRDFTKAMAAAALAPLLPTRLGGGSRSEIQIEVVASSVEDALAALRGGATRLEVAVRLDKGGLTPPLELVREIAHRTNLRQRVMLRENEGLSIGSTGELGALKSKARELTALNVDGIVLGWVKDGQLDFDVMRQIMAVAPAMNFTVHNAIERTSDPLSALRALKQFPSVDRVLVSGGRLSIAERIERLRAYQQVLGAKPRIVAGNLSFESAPQILAATTIAEFHFGDAVRTPEKPYPDGAVDAAKVQQARAILAGKLHPR